MLGDRERAIELAHQLHATLTREATCANNIIGSDTPAVHKVLGTAYAVRESMNLLIQTIAHENEQDRNRLALMQAE